MPFKTSDMFSSFRGIGGERRLNSSVAYKLGLLIISGRLRSGDTLPNEDALSASLSVSRTAYREGIRTLAAKGLIETRPKTGTKVSARSQWSMLDPDVLAWHLEAKPSRDFISSLFELRKIVEPAAAALAAQRRDDLDLGVMQDALDGIERFRRGSIEALEADLAFHRALLKATRNEPLYALSSAIESTLRWSVQLTLQAFPDAQGEALPDHELVFTAIRTGDSEAARAGMVDLIEQARATTLKALARLER